MTVYVAGSFTRIHDGHHALFHRAVWMMHELGTDLVVGVMSDEHISRKYPGKTLPGLDERMKYVRDILIEPEITLFFSRRQNAMDRVKVMEIKDPDYLPYAHPGDILIVSEETAPNAVALIAGRRSPLAVAVVPMVCDENGVEIHSKRYL